MTKVSKLDGIEYNDLSNVEKEIVLLSIKYHMDLMSLKIAEVKEIVYPEDWDKLHTVMKYGQRLQ